MSDEHKKEHGDHEENPTIIRRIKKIKKGGHHGGAWKIAYADFVTAMMAFFLLMWLMGLMNKYQLAGVAEYFKKPLLEALMEDAHLKNVGKEKNTEKFTEREKEKEKGEGKTPGQGEGKEHGPGQKQERGDGPGKEHGQGLKKEKGQGEGKEKDVGQGKEKQNSQKQQGQQQQQGQQPSSSGQQQKQQAQGQQPSPGQQQKQQAQSQQQGQQQPSPGQQQKQQQPQGQQQGQQQSQGQKQGQSLAQQQKQQGKKSDLQMVSSGKEQAQNVGNTEKPTYVLANPYQNMKQLSSAGGSQQITMVNAEDLKKELEEKMEKNPEMQQYKNQLNFIVTADGLKIQLRDIENKSMFTKGKSDFQNYSKKIISWLSHELDSYRNRVEIIGHTDASQYGSTNYTNWELSADRANATRRELVKNGMGADKIIRVIGVSDTDLLDKNDGLNPSNRRIEILILTDKALKKIQH